MLHPSIILFICAVFFTYVYLGKITENPGKPVEIWTISETLCKIPENQGKLPENTSKNGAQRGLIWKKRTPKLAESIFLEVVP